MDLQLNRGARAINYLSKYISKATTVVEGTVIEGGGEEVVGQTSGPQRLMDRQGRSGQSIA